MHTSRLPSNPVILPYEYVLLPCYLWDLELRFVVLLAVTDRQGRLQLSAFESQRYLLASFHPRLPLQSPHLSSPKPDNAVRPSEAQGLTWIDTGVAGAGTQQGQDEIAAT